MGPATKVLLLVALVVPVTAYVAGSLASPGAPAPTDHSPVILRDAPSAPTTPSPPQPPPAPPRDGDRSPGGGEPRDGGGGDKARVVTPQPTPVGEDDDDEWDDDEWDDDGPADDETDDGDDGDDGDD